jgi:serine/threonine-protein kinase
MSPEQAMGDRAVDARSDVYALGCVLYEMLVGEPPFTGPTAQAIVAKVITEKPSLVTATRETAPAHVAAAIQKALAKLPADRFASAAEFAEALVNPRFALAPTSTPAAVSAAALPRRLAALPWIVAAAAVGTAFWLGGLLLAPAASPHPVVRMPLMPSDAVTARDGPGSPLAFSPDGSRIAFLGVDAQRTLRIFLRLLDRVDPVPVPGTESANQPFFSPDGQWIGFHQDGKLRKVAMAGGSAATIAEIGNLQGASWGADDRIVYSSGNRLWRVSAAGGKPELLAEPDSGAGVAYRWPDLLPGGRAVVFTRVADQPVLATLSLSDRKITELGQPGMSPRYVDGGFLAFVQSDGTLFGARFDPRRLRLNNAPEPIAEGIRLGPASVGKLAVSKTGAIAYLVGVTAAQREVVILDRAGRGEPLPLRPERYGNPRFSPDGRRIAVAVIQPGPALTSDIWTWDIARGTMSRLTFDSSSGFPEWSPDGRRIHFTRRLGQGRTGMLWVASDGSGISDTLLVRTSFGFGGRLTPDGRHFVFQEFEGAVSGGASSNSNVWIAPVDTPEAARPLLQNRFNEGNPAISPDGQWLAYQSNESGASEIYVRRLYGRGGRVQVSTSGGINPRWSRNPLELIYRTRSDSLYAVPVQPGPELTLGEPRALFALGSSLTDYDIHPDGRRFAFIRVGSRDTEGLGVVLNWFENRQRRRR